MRVFLADSGPELWGVLLNQRDHTVLLTAWNIIEMGKSKRGESSSDAYKKAKTAVLDAFKAATSDASMKTAQLSECASPTPAK